MTTAEITTDAFSIAPRYTDKTETVEVPTRRNVYDADDFYVGQLVHIGGEWTALYMAVEDFDNDAVVSVMEAAAKVMNDAR